MPYAKTKCANAACSNLVLNRKNRAGVATGLCRSCFDIANVPAPATTAKIDGIGIPEQVESDRQRTTTRDELSGLRLKYKHALEENDRLRADIDAVGYLRANVEPIAIAEHFGGGTSEACPLIAASDWHVEEVIGDEIHGNLNRFNPDIAKVRAERFFQAGLRLVKLLNQDVKIRSVVLALLGDFITNDIHGAENAEKNAMQPTYAIAFAQNLLIGGIEFLLNHSDYEFVIPCHSGNHARTTQTSRFASENGHSLEYLMYLHLAAYFRSEPRIKIMVADGYHSYLPIYDQIVRFHHGHGVKYQGGVGGLTIPTNKAVDQWNKGVWANYDVFGHYHTLFDGRTFLSNGSLCGYNAFALSIKAPYQPPMQWLTLNDKKRGRTASWRIMLETK